MPVLIMDFMMETPVVCAPLRNHQMLEFLLSLSRIPALPVSMRMWVPSLALFGGLRIWCCLEL